jgi:hypothetical protein
VQRDIILLTEMIDAAEQAHKLVDGITVNQLETPAGSDGTPCYGTSPCSVKPPARPFRGGQDPVP